VKHITAAIQHASNALCGWPSSPCSMAN